MSVLISGTVAYDHIMAFPDTFRNHILPDQIHIINVCFNVEEHKKQRGGTAANIAYTMQLLGGSPIPFAAIGTDGKEYLAYLKQHDIPTDYIRVSEKKPTGSAHITTDKEDNQITAFSLGAHSEAHELSVLDVKEPMDLVLISPTAKDAMLAHAKQAHEKNIPLVFDPGQATPAFTKQEHMRTIGQADFLIGNDYEMKLIEKITGWSVREMLEHVPTIIITLGIKGSVILTKDGQIEIPVCPATSIDDPTGAGDGYRAGFFSGHVRGFDLKTCGQMGSVAATFAVEHYGTQNHTFTKEEFILRYQGTYGEKLELK